MEYSIGMDIIGLDKHCLNFTPSQLEFVNLLKDWVLHPRKIVMTLSGGPGTGKTFIVTETLKFIKTQQLRMAYTARSANAIKGRTIHSTVRLDWSEKSLYRKLEKELESENDVNVCIEKSSDILSEFNCTFCPCVIVVDEVGMINGWTIYWLVRYFMDKTKKPLLFIMMGDRHQLHPVRSKQNLFSISNFNELYETKYICLQESKRFDLDYEILINQLRVYVDEENVTNLFTLVSSHFPVVERIDNPLLEKASRAMAFLNSTVNAYNKFYLQEKLPGIKIRLYRINAEKKTIVKSDYVDVKPECLIFVTQNGVSEVSNGTCLIFKSYDMETDVLMCKTLNSDNDVKICRNNKGAFPIDLAFAGTLHKFQGHTMDDENVIINFDGNQNLNLVYTALSRVRNMKQILAIKM